MQAATLGAIGLIQEFLNDAGVHTGYSTLNCALTDGHTVIVTRYCDKAPRVPAPSLYYAFCDEDVMRCQLHSSGGWYASPIHLRSALCRRVRRVLFLTRASPGVSAKGPGDGSVQIQRPKAASVEVGTMRCDSGSQKLRRGAFVCSSEPLTLDTEQWFFIQASANSSRSHAA